MINRKYNIPYTLEGNSNTYQVFNTEGRLLMYFKVENISGCKQLDWNCIESNIDFEFINNSVIRYCLSKIQSNALVQEKVEFYLHKMIERILSNENASKLIIDSYFLTTQGKLKPALYYTYQKLKSNIADNLDSFLKPEFAYTVNDHHIIFDIINSIQVYSKIKEVWIEIDMSFWENQIPNFQVGLSYVNLYHSDATFYSSFDEYDRTKTFLMVLEDKIVMFYFINVKSLSE